MTDRTDDQVRKRVGIAVAVLVVAALGLAYLLGRNEQLSYIAGDSQAIATVKPETTADMVQTDEANGGAVLSDAEESTPAISNENESVDVIDDPATVATPPVDDQEPERCDDPSLPSDWEKLEANAGPYPFTLCMPSNWTKVYRRVESPFYTYDVAPQSYMLQSQSFRKNEIGEAEIGIWIALRRTSGDLASSTVGTGSNLLQEMIKDGRALQFEDGSIITAQPPIDLLFYNAVPKDTIRTLAGVDAMVQRGRITGSRWKGTDARNPIDRENQIAVINVEGEYQIEFYDDGLLHRNDNIFDTIVRSFAR